jgi:purine nucleosidase
MATRLILDTDIGSDIDDAVCLAYLLMQPECELLGITTVTGEPEQRAALASALCQVAGKDIPIYPGVDRPILGEQRQPVAKQALALPRWPHRTLFPQGEAVEFLRRTIRAHPGEITLLTIGPLTNIGLLFALDREIPRLLKQVVMMGGVYLRPDPPAEWNILLDPVAADIVFRSPVPIRAIGLDVTLQVTMDADEVRRRFTIPILRPVLDFAEVWFGERTAAGQPTITFHDPLAGTTVFDPAPANGPDAICGFEPGLVTVDLLSQPGRTVYVPDQPDALHAVAVEVRPERFFDEYFRVVAGRGPA